MSSVPEPRPSVFVVDDTRTVRELVALLLRQLGCQPLLFERAHECMQAIRAPEKPLMVLLDLRMEGVRGEEACRVMREDAANDRVAMVMMTAANSAEEVMNSWRAGADDFLPKPIRKVDLEAKVSRLRTSLAAPAPHPSTRARSRVLVVEDSKFFSRYLGGAMENSGYQLLYASNIQEAARTFEQTPDLEAVLVDLVLPGGGSGLDLVRTFKTQRPEGKIQYLAMSAAECTPEINAEVICVTGRALLEKKQLPVEVIITKLASAMNRLMMDLRSTDRVPFFSIVEFRAKGSQEWLTGFSYDISSNGIFIRTLTPERLLTDVEIRLNIQGMLWPCEGVVAWANSFHPRTVYSYPVGMGIAFKHVDPTFVQEIAELETKVSPAPNRP